MYHEASWDNAKNLTEGALTADLTAKKCSLNYWIEAVAQGTLNGLINGHQPTQITPNHMKTPGPLREAMIEEMSFRSLAEEMATRALSYFIVNAPCKDTMEFFLTQAADEARHSSIFRGHLLEIGIEEYELPYIYDKYASEQCKKVLIPLEKWLLKIVRDNADFIGGVVIFTILIEGILAPAAEISERKWRLIDPAAASIEKGANIDEIRHLCVGASIIQKHLESKPEDRGHILSIIQEGMQLWEKLPTEEVVLKREHLFQQGMMEHKELLIDYELTKGRRLIDTTPEERLEIATGLSRELQVGRLTFMGLEEAIPLLV